MIKIDKKIEVLEKYRKGIPMSVLSDEYGITRQTIHGWARADDIPGRRGLIDIECPYCHVMHKTQAKHPKPYCKGHYALWMKSTAASISYNNKRIKGLSIRQHQRISRAKVSKLCSGITSKMIVHHINGDITDYSPDNLFVFIDSSRHIAYHHRLRRDKRCKPYASDGFYVSGKHDSILDPGWMIQG
jgi:hypothetical protein